MKIKPLKKEQIIISTDRLTRFKNTEIKYLRVFKDIILHNLISPNFSRHELENMSYEDLRNYAQEVFNYSIRKIVGQNIPDNSLNKKLKEYENTVFKLNSETQKLLDNNIDFISVLNLIDEKSVLNLRWLKALYYQNDINNYRYEASLKYPLEIIILVEGATEEILLPEFARICDYDFDKNGVYVIPAGGKNQVVKLYYELSQTLKLPMFVLFDKDGAGNAREIEPRLRDTDKIYIISSGEFEDILSSNLVSRTLNKELKNISLMDENLHEQQGHRVAFLEDVFKHRGMHDFKKAEFAKMIKENIQSDSDLTLEIKEIINNIKKLKSNC